MSETHFCGALILAITFLLIIRYSLRKKNSFLNIREIVCDYWKMLSSLRHRVIFMATPISFGIGLTLIPQLARVFWKRYVRQFQFCWGYYLPH